MSGTDRDVSTRQLVQGSVLPPLGGPGTPAHTLVASFGEARRSTTRLLRELRYGPPPPTAARLLALVPARPTAAGLGRTLGALLTQSRVPDRVVVLTDDSTDHTEDVARRFRGVTVMRTVDNTQGGVGVLNQGWRRWQSGFDHVAAVDPDAVLAADGLQQLEHELVESDRHGGVTAHGPGAPGPAQVSLYRGAALRAVAAVHRHRSPWVAGVTDRHRQLARDLQGAGFQALVSTTAQVQAAARPPLLSRWARPRAADHRSSDRPTDHRDDG